eukprot:TRINITY_DN35636_c0_g1_i1.p1 TRINITY_DN35636_c0_g1~~TRINITY_DN35636_c0_g1_i1.p1  ORF type:complete len:158 (-),score=15.09 TRINITY_DN35636_c0_g1_i1:43-516(-)
MNKGKCSAALAWVNISNNLLKALSDVINFKLVGLNIEIEGGTALINLLGDVLGNLSTETLKTLGNEIEECVGCAVGWLRELNFGEFHSKSQRGSVLSRTSEDLVGDSRNLDGYFGQDFSLDCLLYTSDAADEEDSVDLGGRRIIKQNKNIYHDVSVM